MARRKRAKGLEHEIVEAHPFEQVEKFRPEEQIEKSKPVEREAESGFAPIEQLSKENPVGVQRKKKAVA